VRYRPDDSLAHRLDPRTKLVAQAAFVAVAFAYTTPAGLAALTVLALSVARAARLDPLATLSAYRAFVPFLVAGPAIEALTWGAPWVRPADAVDPALASYRVLLVFLVAGAYVRSTPVRATRAAIQYTVPGRVGTLAGVGVGLTFRFLPVLRGDLARAREAVRARAGESRPRHVRMRLVATAGLRRAFARADRLALALRARCFAWNPTLPALGFGSVDYLVLAGSLALAAVALAGPVASALPT
jgi:biotin transport system permease protein